MTDNVLGAALASPEAIVDRRVSQGRRAEVYTYVGDTSYLGIIMQQQQLETHWVRAAC